MIHGEWAEAKLAVPYRHSDYMHPPKSSESAFRILQEGIPKFLAIPFLGKALQQFDCWVAGGSLIDFVCGRELEYNDATRADNEERRDIDLFCTKECLPEISRFFNSQGTTDEGIENWKITSINESERATLYDTGNYLIHLVKITWPSPYDTINDFDIRAAACAITKDKVFTIDGALDDIVHQVIKIRDGHIESPGRTFYRMLKYIHAKKFKADVDEFVRVIEEELLKEKEVEKEINKWEAYELSMKSLVDNVRQYPILQDVLNEIQKSMFIAERSF